MPTIGAHATSPSEAQHLSPQPAAENGADPLDDELAAQEQRRKDKEEALKQRDARRKSMGKLLNMVSEVRWLLISRSKPKSIFCTRSDSAYMGHARRDA